MEVLNDRYLFRQVVTCVFSVICDQLTQPALESLLAVIRGQGLDGEDEEEDDDESGGEEDDEDAENEDEETKSEEESEEDEEEDSEPEEEVS